MEEIIDVEVTWTYLPEGDYVAKLKENDVNTLEYFLEEEPLEEDWETYIKVENHPENTFCIQGMCVFRNIKTNKIINTSELMVYENKDIEFIKNSIEDTVYITETKKLERI